MNETNEFLQTPIINEELFKLHSPVTSNVSIEEFLPYICIAQELHIESVLGEPLMTELKQQIVDNSLTEKNSALIVKVAPPLAFYAVYQALPFHWATIANKGVTIRESENSKGVNVKDIAQLRRWVKDDADLLKGQLIDYLCKCRTSYPLWRPLNMNCCDQIIPEGQNVKRFDSGFYFPKSRNGCGCE